MNQVFSEFARVVRAKWPLVLAAAVVAGVLAAIAIQLADEERASATIRVGLTSASEWPAYQSDLDSFANIVEGDTLRTEVENSVGAGAIEVRTQGVEGNFVLDVVTSADSEQAAVDAATELAEAGIAQHTLVADGAADQEIAALEAELGRVEASIEELAATEEQARADAIALAASTDSGEFSFESEARYRAADATAARATSDRDAAEQRRRSLTNQRDDLLLRADLPAERVYVVREAQADPEPAVLAGPLPIALAAIAAAMAAAAWLVGRDRVSGAVRTPEQVERVLGLTLLGDLTNGVDAFEGRRLTQALASVGPAGKIGVVVGAKSEMTSGTMAKTLALAASDTGAASRSAGTFVSDRTRSTDAAILAIRKAVTSVDEINEQVRLIEMSQTRLVGVVLT